MDQEKKQQFGPTRSYDMTLKINQVDYSADLLSVRIASTLASVYQAVDLYISISPTDVFINNLYGQDTIELEIKLKDYTEVPRGSIKFDLMLVTTNFNIPMSPQTTTATMPDRATVQLLTIPRKPFKTMSTFVNAVYGITTIPKTPAEVVEALVEDFTENGAVIIDNDDVNPNKIEQICIPPTSLRHAIDTVNEGFGIFNGVYSIFCQYDDIIYVMNLTGRMKQAAILSITQLSEDATNQEDLIKTKSSDGIHFYTTAPVSNNYIGNTMFATLGKNIKWVVSPSDTLYHTIEQDLEAICQTNGLISGNKKIHVSSAINDRTRYYTSEIGFEKTEQFANAAIAKQIYDLARVRTTLTGNIIIDNLLRVGEIVRMEFKTAEHKALDEKYILFSSDIVMQRNNDWQVHVTVELARTNKIK